MIEHIEDLRERERAIDPSASFIVQAPAGSGKTELLMQRYLGLLSIVERPEEVLALTFTRKAAGEMEQRISGALVKAREGKAPATTHEEKTLGLAQKALERDALLDWGLIENPGRLKVQTIDSFCSSIVRQTPLTSAIGAHPLISDNPRELYNEAAKRTVELVDEDSADGESVRKALRHLDNSVGALTRRLVIMLAKRDQWLRHVRPGAPEAPLRNNLEGSLQRIVEDYLGRVLKAFPKDLPGEINAFIECAGYAAGNLNDGSPISALAGITGLPAACARDLPLWKGIRQLLLTDKNTWRKTVNKNTGFPPDKTDEAKGMKGLIMQVIESFEVRDGLLNELSSIQYLPEPRYSDEEWEILSALLHLLPVAERELAGVFAEEGSADFQSISMAALSALGSEDEPTDLMLALDMRIRHILVDEYQDTSRTQLKLLEALTRGWERGDGRTLFVVGDPMQSIYLFREAEVGLFLDARENGVGTVELAPLTLRSNFRSGAKIVEWVNGSFEAAFPVEEDIFMGSIRYSPSSAVRPSSGPAVGVVVTEGRDGIEEAARVASIIKGVGGDESAAILCRSRGHLIEIIKALKAERLKYRAQEMDALSDKPAARDLLALLRAISHPCDRVAWLAVLRAPWCGLGLGDLYALCAGDRTSPLPALLNDESRLSLLGDDARARLLPVYEKMRRAAALRGRVELRDLLEGLWVELGGPSCVTEESSMKDAEAFFDIVGSVSVAGGVDPLKDVEARVQSFRSPESGAMEANVELMTIHKAKGLEFDHVIIPGAGSPPRREEESLLMWLERGDDLLLAPVRKKTGGMESPIYGLLRKIDRDKREIEKTRLLYVAATRAKKRLYIFGHVRGAAEGGFSINRQSLLSTIGHVIKDDMITRRTGPVDNDADEGAGQRRTLRLKRLPLSWRLPDAAPPVRTDMGAIERTAGQEPLFYWAGEEIRHLGTIVHRYLCRIAGEGLALWDRDRVVAEKGRMEASLCALGLGRRKAKERGAEAADILLKALDDERGRWALEGHDEGSVELALTGVVDNEIVRVVIDRTFVEENVRWVIDYKTSRHEGGSLEGFLQSEKERYTAQLEKYAELLKAGGETREIRKGLYYPALSAWVEW
ncbi:MAG: UvrD-helicase domain-containing protein [Deltaproteobacteria bacterium]|nr:UvrD-helicase domain-containing protein [Deltaproteobacteria bacterium]